MSQHVAVSSTLHLRLHPHYDTHRQQLHTQNTSKITGFHEQQYYSYTNMCSETAVL